MKRILKGVCKATIAMLCISAGAMTARAQSSPDTASKKAFLPKGQLWGYAFGDYAFKAHADTVGGGRGGSNQYSKVPKDNGEFQFRRIYLGYNYDISQKFSTEFLLAYEDNNSAPNLPAAGDLLSDGKGSLYIKLANLRWKGIFKGTDLVIGQAATPAFPMSTEAVWGYRSIERTITDIRRTPSFDLGVSLQGRYPVGKNEYGYNLMIGDGNGAKPENDGFKSFYGDVFGKFLDKKLMVDFYADYTRMNWSPGFHHDRNMLKAAVTYSVPRFTVGVEAFYNRLMGDNVAAHIADAGKDTLTTKASGLSVFVRGKIYKDMFSFFARFDAYNPAGNIDNSKYKSYTPLTAQYDPNTKEQFVTAGIDFTPHKNVHIMPNIWYNAYKNAGPKDYGAANNDYDLVYRVTFYYIFGK
ncbi:hypothetical protein [Taibaiella soli]|uniref:Porin n=1 Tax=Taibaiella soli TaxID=1649169 RepID=A0A2W2A9B6_9BACT|nr:hypothetical protein [Taibaiella soli]PZF71861.1 hypothetical protein DN068_17555 [Taibaiella soli]